MVISYSHAPFPNVRQYEPEERSFTEHPVIYGEGGDCFTSGWSENIWPTKKLWHKFQSDCWGRKKSILLLLWVYSCYMFEMRHGGINKFIDRFDSSMGRTSSIFHLSMLWGLVLCDTFISNEFHSTDLILYKNKIISDGI